jgi:hypothetical protein
VAEYRLLTIWRIEAPLEAVYAATSAVSPRLTSGFDSTEQSLLDALQGDLMKTDTPPRPGLADLVVEEAGQRRPS